MNFKPLGDRVLVERVEEPTTTATGIIIPDNAKEKPLTAEVKAVSHDVANVSVGDKVVFAKYSGTEIKLEGVDYLVLNLDDILGVVS
jgi:chaperonin GroES